MVAGVIHALFTFVYSRNKILIHHCVCARECVCCRWESVAYFIWTFLFVNSFLFCFFGISLMQLHNKFIELHGMVWYISKQCNFVYMFTSICWRIIFILNRTPFFPFSPFTSLKIYVVCATIWHEMHCSLGHAMFLWWRERGRERWGWDHSCLSKIVACILHH